MERSTTPQQVLVVLAAVELAEHMLLPEREGLQPLEQRILVLAGAAAVMTAPALKFQAQAAPEL